MANFVSNENMTTLMTGIDAKFDTKVDAVSGKVLSSNDYTDADKAKVTALGTAATKDVPESGNASSTEVVMGNDTRLSDARNAADVYSWAKAENKPSYTATEVGAIASTEKGAANGVAELDTSGKVPSAQLPSYVDDVIEGYYNTTDGKFYEESTYTTEIVGQTGKIYVSLDTDKTYRWSGSAFVEISESLALGETSSTAYAGNKGKANADAITAIKDGSTIDSFGDVESALDDKQDTMQFSTMPTASADYLGKIVQYTGTTNANYEKGFFYLCVSDGEATPTYSWTVINSSSVEPLTTAQVNALLALLD